MILVENVVLTVLIIYFETFLALLKFNADTAQRQ